MNSYALSSFMSQILPAAHVSDTLLVSRHHNFRTFTAGSFAIGTGSAGMTGAVLRVNHFTGSARANANAQPAQHPDHLFRLQVTLARQDHLGDEHSNDRRPTH